MIAKRHLLAGLVVCATASAAPDKPQGALQAQVVEVRAKGLVKIDQGSESGVKDRQVFEIFRDTKAYALPLSGGAALRVDRSVIARGVVVQVDAKSALVHVFDEKGKVEAKQLAVLNPGATGPELPPRVRGHSPQGAQAAALWRKVIRVSLDVDVEPGRRAYYEWRAPAGGHFTNGVEVAPGVYRTTGPENGWVVPLQAKAYPINVTVTDSLGKSAAYTLKLESQGAKQERAANPHYLRTLFSKTKFEGLRDVGFDGRNNLFWLDGTPGTLSGREVLHGVNADGIDLGSAEVKGGNFSAVAVNDDYFYFLDVSNSCVKRFARGGPLAAVLGSDPLKIGDSGSGNGRFKDPVDLALTPDGGVVVLDAGQRCVHRFDSEGRFVFSFGQAGEGDHQLKEPVALAVGNDGSVYVLDNGRKRVVVFKNGRCEKDDVEVGVQNEELRGIAVDDFGSAIAVLERGSGSVKIFAQTREGWSNTFKSASLGSDDVASLRKPARIRMDATRLVYVVDREGESLARFDAASNADFVGRLGGVELSDDVRISASSDSDVVALDRSRRVALRFDHAGWATSKMGFEAQRDGQLKTPLGMGVDADGNVYVVDAKRVEIAKYQGKGGAFLRAFGGEAVFQKIRYGQMSSQREKFIVLMTGDDPHLGVVDPQTGDVVNYKPTATDLEDLDLAAFSGRFDVNAPKEEEGYFWIVDKSGERVSRFTLKNLSPAEVTQSFKKVTGIAASPAGAVFLADRKAKTIEVYAGNGVKLGSIQDDQVESPADVATDDLGHVYVYDDARLRIVELGE